MYLIERQYSADVASTHTLYCFRDRFFVLRDRFRLTGLHSSFARMFGKEALVE